MNQQPPSQPQLPPQPDSGTVTLKKADLQDMISKAVGDAVRQVVAVTPKERRLRNADFAVGDIGNAIQTQEDVSRIATTVGPASHGKDFIPAVPEFVVERDREQHRALISKLEAFGYVVVLHGVEWGVRWDPVKVERHDGRTHRISIEAPEPEEAKPFIAALDALDAPNSRVWLTRWKGRKPLTGDRQVDEAVAVDGNYRAAMLAGVEAQTVALDNLGIDMGSDKGAAMIEKVMV